MKKNVLKWLVAALCGTLAACAIITVNVYFPEKDVKEAYKSLDDMLLKQGQKEGDGKPAGGQPVPAPTPAPENKPHSLLPEGRLQFSLLPVAWGADTTADTLAVELSSMPEVLKAYDEMKARLPQLDALRDSGAVGETSQGLIAVHDPAKAAGQEALIKAENDNRKTVITGMAKAILKINKQPETPQALNQILGKAAATYADTRREAAKPGWWTQLANGRWVQK